jgi:hypothetical protein
VLKITAALVLENPPGVRAKDTPECLLSGRNTRTDFDPNIALQAIVSVLKSKNLSNGCPIVLKTIPATVPGLLMLRLCPVVQFDSELR